MKSAEITSFRAVIDLWPTRAALARTLAEGGKTPTATTVRGWGDRDSIPEPYWWPVIKAAAACGFPPLTYAQLASFGR